VRKVENRPSAEELQKMLEETSFLAVGRKYGVSDNAVRKWAKKYKII
jgi:transposase-like protein